MTIDNQQLIDPFYSSHKLGHCIHEADAAFLMAIFSKKPAKTVANCDWVTADVATECKFKPIVKHPNCNHGAAGTVCN